jgi:hypothetical protein
MGEEVDGQRHAPAALPLGNNKLPIVSEGGWAQGPVWTGADNLATTGILSRTVRSEASLQALSNPCTNLFLFFLLVRVGSRQVDYPAG